MPDQRDPSAGQEDFYLTEDNKDSLREDHDDHDEEVEHHNNNYRLEAYLSIVRAELFFQHKDHIYIK